MERPMLAAEETAFFGGFGNWDHVLAHGMLLG
jgi:hypothetical protein